jgi:hypothetical protein
MAEVHAVENGETVGIYIGSLRRVVSWARRANPQADLRVVSPSASTDQDSPHG